MLTFLDEKDNEYGAQASYSVTNSVNGELSVKGTIYTNNKVLRGIDRGWRFRLDDEYYRVIYAKPNDTGNQIEVEFDAVHQFFYDMSKSVMYEVLDGSNTFERYLGAIFKDSGYTYNLEVTVPAIRKENFGNKSRLSLFYDIIKAAKLEFSVSGHVVRIVKNVGTDLSTIVRKNFNMNELKVEKDINSFVTYQRGLGAWKDENDHSLGRYISAYESPLAKIYGRIEAEPIVDERYKDTGTLLERLKDNVDKSYKISIEIDMEDLSKAGYTMTRPVAGDYIMAINETLGFKQRVRIVSFISEYDVGGNLISRKVTCNDVGSVQRYTSEISGLSRSVSASASNSAAAIKYATQALVAADGKTTNYFGDAKPLDVPKGTLKKGDRLFLTVGDKKELYFWNGAEWELEPTEFDKTKFDAEFDRKAAEIKEKTVQAANKANEALEKAGGIIDSQGLLNKINSQIKADAFNEDGEGAGRRFKAQKQNIQRTIDRIVNLKSETTLYQQTNDAAITRLTQSLENTVTKAEMKQTADGIRETIAEVQTKGSGGPNMIRNSRADEGLKYWTEANNRLGFTSHPFYLNGQKRMFELRPGAVVKSPRFIVKRSTDYTLNVLGFDNNSKYFRIYFCKRKKGSTADFDEKQLVFDGQPRWVDGAVFDNGRTVKKTLKFNVGEFDDGYLQFEYDKNNPNKWGGLFLTEIDFYEGTNERLWQPAPEDGAEWLDSRVTTLDRTLDGIKATVTQVKNYADADGQRKQELTQLVRDETAKGVTTLLTKVEEAGYVKRTEVQSVIETQKLYDRLIGTTEENVKQNIARMTMTDSLFQTEISKLVSKELDVTNYVIDPYEISNYRLDSYTAIKQVALETVSGSVYNKLTFVVDTQGNRNIYIPMYSLSETTQQFSFAIKIETAGGLQVRNIYYRSNNNSAYTLSKSVNGDVYTGSLPILGKNSKINPELQIEFSGTGTAKISKPIVIEGTEAKSEYEPTKIERLLTQSEKAGQAVKTIQTQLAGSWAVKNLNSAGDIVGQVNLTDGDFRFVGKRFHITGETLIDNAAIKSAAIESVSADKITAGTIDANRVNLINLNANSITSGTISGIDIKGSIFKGQNDEFVIDSKNNSLLFSQNTFLGFENNKYSQYSVFSDGSRIVNGSGSGLVIAAGVDKSDFDYLKNRPNNRDLYTILSGGKSAAYLAVGADNSRTRGVITATARTGLKFQVSKSGGAFLTIGDGSAVGENIGRALLHGDDVILSSSRNMQISCPNLKLLKNNKDLIEYHNALARLVKMIAERNGWTNVTDYSI